MTDKQKTKIYVVTKGSYSDYHIITATTDEKLAYKIAKKFSDKYEEADVEIYEDAELVLKPLYRVEFYSNGDIHSVRDCSDSDWEYRGCNIYNSHLIYGGGHIYVTADNADHAVKIANEKRAEYLAREAGIV